jgi:hypothetical protein
MKLKLFLTPADNLLMTNPISSSHAGSTQQLTQSSGTAQPARQPQKSTTLPQDTVTLKSAGDVDHDGDSK